MRKQEIEFRDPVVQSVVNKFVDRSDVGFAKYGKTLRDDQSDIFAWLNHLQEELMDATLYLQRLKEEISTLREEKELLKHINDIDEGQIFWSDIEVEYIAPVDNPKKRQRKNNHGRIFSIDNDDPEFKQNAYKLFIIDENPFTGFNTTFNK